MTYQPNWSENEPTIDVDPPILDVNVLAELFLGEEEFGLQEEFPSSEVDSCFPGRGSLRPQTIDEYNFSPQAPVLVTPETGSGSMNASQGLNFVPPNSSSIVLASQGPLQTPFILTQSNTSPSTHTNSSQVPPSHFAGTSVTTAYANPINMMTQIGQTTMNQSDPTIQDPFSQFLPTQFPASSGVPNITLADLQKLFQQHGQSKDSEPGREPIYAVAAEENPTMISHSSAVTETAVPPRQKTNHSQIDRRRERNRILARKTRERKKAAFETLQEEILELQRQNEHLKTLVETTIPEPHHILNECDAMDKIPDSVFEACGRDIGSSQLENNDFDFVRGIQEAQQAFVITDPSMEDNPIVFASPDFLKMTGYSSAQVLGRNCRFLQGKDTSPEKLGEIRKALACGEDVTVTLVNYTADATPFWNKLFIAALRDVEHNIVNYIGVSVKVACPPPGDAEFGFTLDGE